MIKFKNICWVTGISACNSDYKLKSHPTFILGDEEKEKMFFITLTSYSSHKLGYVISTTKSESIIRGIITSLKKFI